MTGIGLFNRNHVEEAADPGLEGPDSFDVRQSTLFDAVPHLCGANHSLGERIIRWRPARPRDAQDRIVAIIDAFDPKHGRVFHLGAVVTEPLPKRSIGFDVSRMKKSLDSNLRVGGKRQAGDLTFDEIVGSDSDAATVIVLGITKLDGVPCGQKQQRILAHAQDDGAGFSLLKIFFHVHASMLARGRHKKSHGIRVMHHCAISAEVEPAILRVPRDGDACRADKTTAIQLMNFWHGELEYVDRVAGHHVFKDRSGLYNARWNRLELVELFFEPAD